MSKNIIKPRSVWGPKSVELCTQFTYQFFLLLIVTRIAHCDYKKYTVYITNCGCNRVGVQSGQNISLFIIFCITNKRNI